MVSLAERRPPRRAFWLGVGRWIFVLGALALSTQLRSPLLLKVRLSGSVLALFAAGLIAALAVRARRRAESQHQRGAAALLLLCGLAMGAMVVGLHGRFWMQKRRVLSAPVAVRAELGRHIVAGFRSWEEARELVGQGLVGGIYIGLHNVRGLSAEALRLRIDELRALRAELGLSPLLVAVDQEGGPVSRLSPPLPFQPALSAVIADADSPAERERRVRAFAGEQAAALRQLGANINFSPVVDLRLHPERSLFDRYSFIGARAIAAEPALVAAVARTYAEALIEKGVVPTAKHFPGLGRVRADTHFFTATLDTDVAELTAADWLPFRATVAVAPTLLMLGHVRVAALDRDNLASGSARLIAEVVRGQWGHNGVLITDDLCMGPVFYGAGGLPGFAQRALAAGVDLLLISYDGTQVYPALAALLAARTRGELRDDLLQASTARLARLTDFLQ